MLEAIIGLTRSLDRVYCGGIFEQSMGTRNRVGMPRQAIQVHSLTELFPWNRFGLLKSLKIRAQNFFWICSMLSG
jgi:hypothetical protein